MFFLQLSYIILQMTQNKKTWFKCRLINKIRFVQRGFARFINNRCTISHTSYNDRLVKLGSKSPEIRR